MERSATLSTMHPRSMAYPELPDVVGAKDLRQATGSLEITEELGDDENADRQHDKCGFVRGVFDDGEILGRPFVGRRSCRPRSTGGDEKAPRIVDGQRQIERLFGARTFLQGGRVEAAAAHLRCVEGLFVQAGHGRFRLEATGIVGAFRRVFMRAGVKKLGALCHRVDSFVSMGKNAAKKSHAGTACRSHAAVLCRPPPFGCYAPPSLRPANHRKTSRPRIYRREVALT